MNMRPALACLLALALSGCANMPQSWSDLSLENMFAKKPDAEANYKPLSSEVAVIAAPQQDGDPGPGGVVCRVSKGSAHFGERWLDFEPAEFTLPVDTRVSVTLDAAHGDGQMKFQSWFDAKTQEMLFCPVIDGPPDKKIPCASIYALDEDLAMGIKRTFDIPGAVGGSALTCAHTPDKLKK
jgi:hypothetical protein